MTTFDEFTLRNVRDALRLTTQTPVVRAAVDILTALVKGEPLPEPSTTTARDMDALAAAAHDAWYAEKRIRLDAIGLPPTWPSEAGEEQLVPWADLSEPVRDFDRIVVRAIVGALLSEPVMDVVRDVVDAAVSSERDRIAAAVGALWSLRVGDGFGPYVQLAKVLDVVRSRETVKP